MNYSYQITISLIRRRAFSLTELLAVMACLAVMMSVSTTLFFQAFEFQIRHDERAHQTQSVNRLIEQFRSDARVCVQKKGTVQIAPEENVLFQWTVPESEHEIQTIRYERRNGEFPQQSEVIRSVDVSKNGEQERLATEKYRLPDHATLRFFTGSGEFQGLAAMSLWTNVSGTAPPSDSQFNPFARTMTESTTGRLPEVDPKFAGNWRTVIVHTTSQ